MGDLSVTIQDLWTQSCPAYGFSLISLFGLSGYNYFCSLYFFWLFPSGSYTKKNLKQKNNFLIIWLQIFMKVWAGGEETEQQLLQYLKTY
jgi:hypothetical protein